MIPNIGKREVGQDRRHLSRPLLFALLALPLLALFVLALVHSRTALVGAAASPSAAEEVHASPQLRLYELPKVGLTQPEYQPKRLIYDDKSNLVWFPSWEAGGNFLVSYNPVSDNIHRYQLPPGMKTTDYYLGFDQAIDGSIWIGWGNSLVSFSPSDKNVKEYRLPAAQHAVPARQDPDEVHKSHIIYALAAGEEGRIWLTRGGNSALSEYDVASGEYREYACPDEVTSAEQLVKGENDTIWLAGGEASTSEGGTSIGRAVASFNTATHRFRLLAVGKVLNGLAVARDGQVWLGGAEGIAAYDSSDGDRILPPSRPGDVVLGIDSFGRVWSANVGGGKLAVSDSSESLKGNISSLQG